MSFKHFAKKASKGEITGSDVSRVINVRVEAAEGYVRTIGNREAPVYRSTIEVASPGHSEAVERAMRAAG